MKFFSQRRQPAQVAQLFINLSKARLTPTPQIISLLLDVCEQTHDLALAERVFAQLGKDLTGVDRALIAGARLKFLRILCHTGEADRATAYLTQFIDEKMPIGLEFLNPVLAVVAEKELEHVGSGAAPLISSSSMNLYHTFTNLGVKPNAQTFCHLFRVILCFPGSLPPPPQCCSSFLIICFSQPQGERKGDKEAVDVSFAQGN